MHPSLWEPPKLSYFTRAIYRCSTKHPKHVLIEHHYVAPIIFPGFNVVAHVYNVFIITYWTRATITLYNLKTLGKGGVPVYPTGFY